MTTIAQAIGSEENFLLVASVKGSSTYYMTGPTHTKFEIEKLIGFDKPSYELTSMIALGVGEENTPKKPLCKLLEEVVAFID